MRNIILLVLALVLVAFLVSDNSVAVKIRQGIGNIVISMYNFFFPDQCYVPISGVKCSNVKIAQSGIEVTFKNNIGYPHESVNYLSVFNVTIDICSETLSAENGLHPAESEKFVFRDCDVGPVGSSLSTNVELFYIEGALSYGIKRNATGVLFGKTTY